MEGNFEDWEEGWRKYVCVKKCCRDCDWFNKRNNLAEKDLEHNFNTI